MMTSDHGHDSYHEQVDTDVDDRDDRARRRRKEVPTDENLLVVACTDGQIPVEDVLGLELGDAQIYRNADGKPTDDVIRSAALTTDFFDTDLLDWVRTTDDVTGTPRVPVSSQNAVAF